MLLLFRAFFNCCNNGNDDDTDDVADVDDDGDDNDSDKNDDFDDKNGLNFNANDDKDIDNISIKTTTNLPIIL